MVLDLARSVMPLSIPVEGSALAAACRVGRSELSPKEGDSTTDGLSSRCRQGQWANSRSAAAFLFSLIAGSLGLVPWGGGDAAGRGGSPWIYDAGFCVSPSGPGRFQQHSHNGPRWTGQDGTASGPLPFCTAGGAIRRMGQAYFLNEARGSELRG